jgi:Domain of unknown function (DUF4118)
MMGRLSPFRRYAVAGLLTVMALSLALIGEGTWGSAATYSFFLGAVMLSSWVGGPGPGIMATVLSTLAADYFLIPPLQYPAITGARIAVGDIDARTERFALIPWVQRAEFQTSDGRNGVIEVTYREARPDAPGRALERRRDAR